MIFDKEVGRVYVPEDSMDEYKKRWKDEFKPTDYPDICLPLVMAESVKLDCDRIEESREGDVFELKASVLPEDALQYVFFKSTDPRMATVTQDGVVTIKDTTVNAGDNEIGYCEILVYIIRQGAATAKIAVK